MHRTSAVTVYNRVSKEKRLTLTLHWQHSSSAFSQSGISQGTRGLLAGGANPHVAQATGVRGHVTPENVEIESFWNHRKRKIIGQGYSPPSPSALQSLKAIVIIK